MNAARALTGEAAAAPPEALPARPLVARVTLATIEGRIITSGRATIAPHPVHAWTAVVRDLDRPGVIASIYFCERVRDVVLHLADGRQARSRIAATSFDAGRQRVCELRGVEPFAPASIDIT